MLIFRHFFSRISVILAKSAACLLLSPEQKFLLLTDHIPAVQYHLRLEPGRRTNYPRGIWAIPAIQNVYLKTEKEANVIFAGHTAIVNCIVYCIKNAVH